MVINKFPNREVYKKIKEKGSLGADDVNVLEDYSVPEWKGEYSSTAIYVKGDIVYYENMLYVMVSSSAIGAIPGIDNDWIDFAKRSVTSSDVTNALGFTPADSTKVLPLSGGTLTGNLTGKYIIGTWLQATDAGHLATTPTKIPVFDDKGWIYYRTPAEILKDIGASSGYTLTEADKTEIAGKVVADGTEFTLSDFPTALKNPKALTFTGAATGTYDGSAALTITIPEGGAGGASINWRGEWAETTKYSKLDAVSYEGSSYIFASDTPAIGAIPGIDGEWQLMAQGGGSGTDLSLGVTGATVGQIAKITAVDASGVSTAWEPVDMPSGGDESDFEKVVEMTTPGDAAVISISTDKNGNPLSMSEFYVAITTARNNAATANNHFNCNVLPDTVPSHIRAASAITNITLFQDVYCYVMHYKLIGRMIFNECAGRQRTASGLNVAEYIENEKSIHISAVVSEGTIGFLPPTDARTGESKVNSAGKMYCITFGANSTDCIFGAGTRVEVWAR